MVIPAFEGGPTLWRVRRGDGGAAAAFWIERETVKAKTVMRMPARSKMRTQ